jgi:N-acetylglucosamine kinase-like BadF-type ATPase
VAIALSAQEPGAITELAIGATGLSTELAATEWFELVADRGIKKVALAHDSVTSYLGALGQEHGVVIAAGTGTVALALGERSVARVDGWGSQLGDAGSGFWIGRAGLEMVMRAYDGRGPATALSAFVKQDFPNLEDAYLAVQNDPGWVARVAGYAKIVAGLAETDEVCGNIIDAAAIELASTALTGLRRTGEDKQLSTYVATQGKIFLSERLKARFTTMVSDNVAGVRFVRPMGDALDGVAQLFLLHINSPLRSLVRYS